MAWDTRCRQGAWRPTSPAAPAWRLEGALAAELQRAAGGLRGHCRRRRCSFCARPDPQAAAHHDEEAVAAVLVSPEGEPEAIEEALVSTEYAADGAIRRLGLELYKEGDDYPVRGAGDATDTGAAEADGERRDAGRARLPPRRRARERALYEIVHPA